MTELEKQLFGIIVYSNKAKDLLFEIDAKYLSEKGREIYSFLLDSVRNTDHLLSSEIFHKFGMETFNDLREYDVSDMKFDSVWFKVQEEFYVESSKLLVKDYNHKFAKLKFAHEVDDLKAEFESKLYSLDMENDSNFDDMVEVTKKIDENIVKSKEITGYSTGIHSLDSIINGIEVPSLTVLGALKKAGKTRFVINLRKALYFQGVATPFLSLEMSSYKVAQLTYASFCEINDKKFSRTSMISNEEIQRYNRVKATLDWSLMPTEHISGLNISQIVKRIKKYSVLYPNCVIFIDHLHRVLYDNNREAQELSFIANTLADLTRNYNVAIVLLAQLNNLAERETPTIGHLRGSGGIAEAADTIIIMDNYNRKAGSTEKDRMDFHITQRYGENGTVELVTDLGICAYKPYARGF